MAAAVISTTSIENVTPATTSSTHEPKTNRISKHVPSKPELSRSREQCKEVTTSCKRPRSRAMARGPSIRVERENSKYLDDLDADLEESSSDGSGSSGALGDDASSETHEGRIIPPGTSPFEVPILSLLVHKRKGKEKAALDEWDVLPKPGSRAIITLDDEDQEFLDGWAPEYYVEEDVQWGHPLYSEVLRMGLEEVQKKNENDSVPIDHSNLDVSEKDPVAQTHDADVL